MQWNGKISWSNGLSASTIYVIIFISQSPIQVERTLISIVKNDKKIITANSECDTLFHDNLLQTLII